MIQIDNSLEVGDLTTRLRDFWRLSAQKIRSIENSWTAADGAPVFTIAGRYSTRGWTEWTQGFQFGSAILQFDATGDEEFLEIGRENTRRYMASHVTHFGVHDHGFNNVSTYGNLLRLMNEKRIPESAEERDFYELALKASAAVQAHRWTCTSAGGGFIYSFNGPHSLFADTIRSLRSLAIGHRLGHVLMGERDVETPLLERLLQHARATADYSVYYGQGRDIYDVRGRVAHESLFNTNDGNYRAPSTQQGYSPFSTWTRGLAWVMLGFAEELEFVDTLKTTDQLTEARAWMLRAAQAACDFYIEHTPLDGIPYWDTGAPGLSHVGGYLDKVSDPFNSWEPVDSSAAAIGCQGLLRLGRYLQNQGDAAQGRRYWQAGLKTLSSLLTEPYLSVDPDHQGLILHSIYHRPNGWDHIPEGSSIPLGESSMWGDYHAREAALYIQRIINHEPYYTFFGS
ncbi:MAG: glycoside hydrolase family 88 protein [Armatimonadetes bacterium]|nr:glycoside hydrolase family 88 protein [Armatimonadota bacterium]